MTFETSDRNGNGEGERASLSVASELENFNSSESKLVQFTDDGRRKPPRAGMGRKPGAKNRHSLVWKQAVAWVFDEIGGLEAFAEWADENRTEFFKLASKTNRESVGAPLVNVNLGGGGGPVSTSQALIRMMADINIKRLPITQTADEGEPQ